MNTHFKNAFGEVSFRLISEVLPVHAIHGADLDSRCMFGTDTAAQIALITDNNGVQLAPYKTLDGWRMYVVLHETPSTAAVAEIECLTYVGGNPHAEILRAARREPRL